jgi:hypothetical protein
MLAVYVVKGEGFGGAELFPGTPGMEVTNTNYSVLAE